jgi:hypothetical protein
MFGTQSTPHFSLASCSETVGFAKHQGRLRLDLPVSCEELSLSNKKNCCYKYKKEESVFKAIPQILLQLNNGF